MDRERTPTLGPASKQHVLETARIFCVRDCTMCSRGVPQNGEQFTCQSRVTHRKYRSHNSPFSRESTRTTAIGGDHLRHTPRPHCHDALKYANVAPHKVSAIPHRYRGFHRRSKTMRRAACGKLIFWFVRSRQRGRFPGAAAFALRGE